MFSLFDNMRSIFLYKRKLDFGNINKTNYDLVKSNTTVINNYWFYDLISEKYKFYVTVIYLLFFFIIY